MLHNTKEGSLLDRRSQRSGTGDRLIEKETRKGLIEDVGSRNTPENTLFCSLLQKIIEPLAFHKTFLLFG